MSQELNLLAHARRHLGSPEAVQGRGAVFHYHAVAAPSGVVGLAVGLGVVGEGVVGG